MYRKLATVKRIAKELGIECKIENSDKKNKRFKITLPDSKVVHFGLWPFTGKGTYIDHHDNDIRDAWQARHSKILKNGKPAYLNPNSPEFYSWNFLW